MDSQHDAQFPLSRWSIIRRAGGGDANERQRALATLCADYRGPLLKFLRRKFGLKREDAEDIVQGFLLKLATSPMVSRADPEKGRFQTFLSSCIEDYQFDELRKMGAQKRGGGIERVSLSGLVEGDPDFDLRDSSLTPDELLQHNMDCVTRHRAVALLEAKFSSDPAKAEIARLFLVKQELAAGSAITSEDIARRHILTKSAVDGALHRMQSRFEDALREAVAETVPLEEIEAEMRRILLSFRR